MGAASRPRPIRNNLGYACSLALLLAPSDLLAAKATYRLQLVRAEGAGSCPSAAQIERDVAERLRRDPFSEQGERGIEIVVQRVETRWQAWLYLRVDASEVDAVRLIESDAEDCAELGQSVALAVALAIAPELPPEPKPTPPPPEPEPCPPPPSPLLPPPTVHGEASLRALVSPNLLPRTAPGAALTVTLRGELIGVALGGAFYPQTELRTAEAHLGFGLSAGFASGCLWARTSDPQIWSCIGARVGALHSVVYSPDPVQPGDRFWWAASSELGLRQHFLRRAFVELGAAALFPLVRHRFQVDASPAPVYQQGAASVEGFVGIGLRLD
ncbi:MAG TPA: hypothetical protein VJN18_04145 [Polyangiaceae bacterium]|nr:hypothetical protein [Polyangiaceae bacterium]